MHISRRGGTDSRRKADPVRLETFIRETGVSFKPTNKSFVFTCPRCNKPDKLYIYRDGSSFICFVCAETTGFKGAPEYGLKEITGLPVPEIRKALYGAERQIAGEELLMNFQEDEEVGEELDLSLDFAPDLIWPLHCYPLDSFDAKPGAKYLIGRGIPTDIAMEYDIRYSTEEKSIAFPVTVGEQMVGYQYRIIGPERYMVKGPYGDEPRKRLKVRSTPDIPRDKVVMFQNRLIGASAAVLCEGPVDALKAHYIGGNVATMGKAVSDKQVAVIRNSGVKKVFIALDPDAALDIDPLVIKLGGIETCLVEVPKPYKDLGEMPLDLATTTVLDAQPVRAGRMYFFIK